MAEPLHLIKLCVGCDSVRDLEEWIAEKLAEKKRKRQPVEHIHTTRMVPTRADELKAGGSLYWVIRGQITCREKILDIRPFTDKDGIPPGTMDSTATLANLPLSPRTGPGRLSQNTWPCSISSEPRIRYATDRLDA